MTGFVITAPCYVDHVHGLLKGRVLSRKVDGSAYQVGVDLQEIDPILRLDIAGKRWYAAVHVITPAERDARVLAADEIIEGS